MVFNSQHDKIYVGCAGWALRAEHKKFVSGIGSHLEQYSQLFNSVEINSSFYKPHQRKTYARWASAVPSDFRFSVKVPKAITHEGNLENADLLEGFLDQVLGLEEKLGVLLIQFPPKLSRLESRAAEFFSKLRDLFQGKLACEPRHPSWWDSEGHRLFSDYRISLVAADPAVGTDSFDPTDDAGILYYRLHGSPERYYSSYSSEFLAAMRARLEMAGRPVFCIFDNTAAGYALPNAIELVQCSDSVGL